MRLHRSLILLAAAPTLATVAAAQGVTTLVLEGDNIPGVGNVTKIDNIWINSSGDYFVEVTTDNASANANQAILKNGSLYLQEGQALTSPSGATLKGFDSLSLNTTSDAAFNFTLNGATSSTDSGVYWNDKLVLQEGTMSTSSVFSLQTPYIEFKEVRVNDNNQILMMAAVDDGTIPSTSDACVVVLDTDGNGNITGETVLWKEGDAAGGGGDPATLFSSQAHLYDFNNAGSVMHQIFMATGSGANDIAIYVDNTIVAQEAGTSPIAGRNWSTLSAPAMSLNNNGDWVMKGFLDGSNTDNQIIVKNNVKVVQKGDLLAATGGWLLEQFAQGPVEIADSGDILWFGNWDDPNTAQDTGLFVNMSLLVQEGVTTIGANTIKALRGSVDGYHISENGSFILFEAELDNGLEGAFLIGTGEPGDAMCYGDGTGAFCPCGNFGSAGQGCQNSMGNGAVLGGTGSNSVAAANIGFNVSGLAPFKPTMLMSSTSNVTAPMGDGVSCVGSTPTQHGVVWANGGGTASWSNAQITNQNWVAGQDTYFQAIYRDQGGPCAMNYNTSAGYKVSFVP